MIANELKYTLATNALFGIAMVFTTRYEAKKLENVFQRMANHLPTHKRRQEAFLLAQKGTRAEKSKIIILRAPT